MMVLLARDMQLYVIEGIRPGLAVASRQYIITVLLSLAAAAAAAALALAVPAGVLVALAMVKDSAEKVVAVSTCSNGCWRTAARRTDWLDHHSVPSTTTS
jgi:hypothetical protein